MVKLILFLLPWCVPLLFVILGSVLRNRVQGHSFLGLVCFGVAGAIGCYYCILYLPEPVSVVLRNLFTLVLSAGFLVYAVTLGVIFLAGRSKGNEDCAYIIVLGAKINGTQPSRALLERVRAAFSYLCVHPDTIAILSGGQGLNEEIAECDYMYRELIKMGISTDRLVLENRSTTTWENLRYSLALMDRLPHKIGLVSSEYHLFRACLFAKRRGVEPVGIPAKSTHFTTRLNDYLREGAGIWHYIILGGKYHD